MTALAPPEARLVERLGPPFPESPQRVVSLCPSVTESLFVLGAGERVVGATRFCIRPAGIGVARVGGTKDPDHAAIHALRPDLLLANREENRWEDVLRLAEEIPTEVSFPCGPAEVPPLLRGWGSLFEVRDPAEAAAEDVERELSACAAAARPFRFAYLVWRSPWMLAGERTYVSALVSAAGGTNVAGEDAAPYPETDLGRLRELAPDVVLLPDEPYPFREKHREELLAAGMCAELVSGDDFCWHGTRTTAGLRAAALLPFRFAR